MMESARFQQALRRLEAAIGRLEQAAGRPRANDERLAELEARHARLREGAQAALERLDRLIGGAS